jgi:hypothetical protein
VDHDAIDADAALNIDLSDKLPVENVQGRIELPVDAKNPFHMGRAYYQVIARGTAVAIGFPTRTHLNEEKDAFTYEGEHVVVSNAGEVMTAYYLYYISGYPSSAAFSLLFRDGYPLDGETIGGFLAPPTILQPSDTSVSTSMSEPISWIVEDPDVESSSLAILAGQNVVWFVNVKEGSSARIPKLPSTANPISFFGMGKLSAVVMHLADCDDLFRCDRRVDSTPIPLKL